MANQYAAGNAPATPSQVGYIDAYKNMVAGGTGQEYTDYIKAKQPPLSPYDIALRDLEKSGVGDLDYEREQLMRMYQSGPLKAQQDKFYADNSEWFNPDGSRNRSNMSELDNKTLTYIDNGRIGTNPVAAALRDYAPDTPVPTGTGVAGEGKDNGTIGNPTPNGGVYNGGSNVPPPQTGPVAPPPVTPSPIVEARPSIIQQPPQGGGNQQQQIAAALRAPDDRFASKPAPQSSWQAGGWG